MNEADKDNDCVLKFANRPDLDDLRTPTNISSSNLVKFSLGKSDESNGKNNDFDENEDQDLTLDENTINSDITENKNDSNFNRQTLINSYCHSMPQFPVHPNINLLNPLFQHHGQSISNFNTFFNPNHSFNAQNLDDKENQQKNLNGLFNDYKINPFNFHSLDTFGFFIRYTLNLKSDLVKEILSNHKIQYWIDRNNSDGFVYQNLPKNESKNKIPPVRCDLCKFHGHLSHNCSIKELAFKLYNVALKSGACRCHICGQLGHPAEAGLCPYLACSFCRQFGHWNHMCPNIDKVSRTLCYKCQRYGHKTERCPDQWRQFDRISTYEQTPYKDPTEENKPVYCYQCAKKGHYGHNCPDFYRKYFIRDNHQLNPVYFFAGSSPFVKYSVDINETDHKIINHLVDNPLDDTFKSEQVDQDPLELLEMYQARQNNTNKQQQQQHINTTSMMFNETQNQTQIHTSNMPFKKYIRKWSNWVIDFNWIFTLKFLAENLQTNKLYFLIKNYPILDNFILHWMWWSYTVNKDLEEFTKDPFRGVGSLPWLVNDINNNNNKTSNNNSKKLKLKKRKKPKNKTENKQKALQKNYSSQKFKFSIESFIFLRKTFLNKKWISCEDFISENKPSLEPLEPQTNSYEKTCSNLKSQQIDLCINRPELSSKRERSKSMVIYGLINDFKAIERTDCNQTDEEEEEGEDLENTIVYLDKEKPIHIVNTVLVDQVPEPVQDAEGEKTNDHQEEQPSVFDKFIKSFSNGQTDASSVINTSNEDKNNQTVSKKENNESLNKLIDLLKKSNKIKSLDQGLIITVSDLPNDSQVPSLDSAPTVEQIETEILAPCDPSEKQTKTDSTDLIKLLLNIDKNVSKPKNLIAPAIHLIDNEQQSNPKLSLFEILKGSIGLPSAQNDQNLMNTINIDTANQKLLSSSSSSSGSCLSLSSLSSISPQPSILSSNSSPNSLSSSSSNSTTAKPNTDSSFSTSISSSKSVDQVSTSSVSLSSSSSSVSLELTNKKQLEKNDNNQVEEQALKKVDSDKIDESKTLQTGQNKILKNNVKLSRNNNNRNNKSMNFQRSNQPLNRNQMNLTNYSTFQNRSLNNSKMTYSGYNLKQYANNNLRFLNNFQNHQFVNYQSPSVSNPSLSNTATNESYHKRSSSNASLTLNNKFTNKSDTSSNTQAYQSQNTNVQALDYFTNSSVQSSSLPEQSIQSQLDWQVYNSFNIVNTNSNSVPNFNTTSSSSNNNYKTSNYAFNKQVSQSNQFKQQVGSKKFYQNYMPPMAQFQQIYNPNNSSSSLPTPSTSITSPANLVNQKQNSSSCLAQQQQNYQSLKKSNNSFMFANPNSNQSPLNGNNTNNGAVRQTGSFGVNMSYNSKKNFRKNIP